MTVNNAVGKFLSSGANCIQGLGRNKDDSNQALIFDPSNYQHLFRFSTFQFWYNSLYNKLQNPIITSVVDFLALTILMHFRVDPYPKDLDPMVKKCRIRNPDSNPSLTQQTGWILERFR